jgi:hypothetical protein
VKDIKAKNVRKVARSLYSNEAPMAGITIENRMRGESNYTAKSGDQGFSSHEDRDSLTSSNRKFRSTKISKKLNSRKNSKNNGVVSQRAK